HPAGAEGDAADRRHVRHRRERDHPRLGQGPRHRERAADQDRGRLRPEAGGGRADDPQRGGARRGGAPAARDRRREEPRGGARLRDREKPEGAPRLARGGRGLDARGSDHGAQASARRRRRRRDPLEDGRAAGGLAQARRGGLRQGERGAGGERRQRCLGGRVRRRGDRGRRGRRRGGPDELMTDPKVTRKAGTDPSEAGSGAGEAGAARPEDRGAKGTPGAGSGAGEAGAARPEDRRAGGALGEGSVPDVEALEKERDEYLDSLQRLKAEFDNFRKRTAREHESMSARANEAAEEAPRSADERSSSARTENRGSAKLEEGVRLVQRSLVEVARKHGLEEIETNGAFDPHVHEALLAQPAEDAESGSVLQVLQKGYRLGDRVLRPARVVVAE